MTSRIVIKLACAAVLGAVALGLYATPAQAKFCPDCVCDSMGCYCLPGPCGG